MTLKTGLTIFAITILLLEISLRLFGNDPGVFRDYNGFSKVDELIVYKNYENDDNGIYKFSPTITNSLQKNLKTQWFKKDKQSLNFSRNKDVSFFTDSLYQVIYDFKSMEDSPFSLFVNKIKEKEVYSSEDSLIIKYVNTPFNQEVFRCIPMQEIKTKKKKVLLLGDSFTFGLSALPIHNSFADYLLSKDFLVYNTGIAGVDPAQYFAITDKYLPKILPDVVVLNFCINNDLMLFDRELDKNKPHEHLTNAGFLYSNPEGSYLSPKDAYEYYLNFICIPIQNNLMKDFFYRKTAVGTKIWSVFFNLNIYSIPDFEKYLEAQRIAETNKIEITKKYLLLVQKLCQDNNVPILFCLIPDVKYHKNDEFVKIIDQDVLKLFENIDYYYPNNFTSKDFVGGGNYHFNNDGSKKYGEFLEKIILETLYD